MSNATPTSNITMTVTAPDRLAWHFNQCAYELNFVFYVTLCTAYVVLNVASDSYRYVFPTFLHFLECFYIYISL